MGDPRKNRLPAGIRGWVGTATGGHIHVVHISHTYPPKELIQALRKYLFGKTTKRGFGVKSYHATRKASKASIVWDGYAMVSDVRKSRR